MSNTTPRKSHENHQLSKEEFVKRYQIHFYDPDFESVKEETKKITEVAWKAYENSHKAPKTEKAGEGFKDPNYDLSSEWIKAHEDINKAKDQFSVATKPRVLLISASNRNDQTCPGEISKTSRLLKIAHETLQKEDVEVEVLDLSRITSEYGKTIHPCKGCVATAMPLCHWPCSCYPNHSLGQIHDWMNDIYPMWVRSHGVMIITPVYWHQAPSALKLMMDRMVCADGGNPDPTTTQGKKAQLAKELELNDWNYPRHLEGRVYSVLVHGDTQGADQLKSALCDWLDEMMLIPCGNQGSYARYIGYFEPYATSHEALDKDISIQNETVNAALSLALAARAKMNHLTDFLDPQLKDPRPK